VILLRFAILLFATFFSLTEVFAQEYLLSGTVKNTEGESLPGATVFIHELNIGTAANAQGEFEFKKIKSGAYHVHVSFTGYETAVKSFKVRSGSERIHVVLKPTTLELKAFVVEESSLNIDNEERSMNVEVIDREFIQRAPAVSFAASLEKLPGLSTINMGPGIAKPVIRGMSFNRIAVAENGIKQEGQQWGADHGLEIDRYNVERVEVIKGPASLIYGSDAMGGVINIRPPVFPQENTFSSSVNLFGADNNQLLGTSLFTGGSRKGKMFRFRYTRQEYADYRVPASGFVYNRYVLPLENNRLKNTAGNENSFSGMFGVNTRAGYSTITASVFKQQAGLFAGAHGIPRAYQLGHDGDYRNIGYPSQSTDHYKIISNTNVLVNKNWLTVDIGAQQNHRREFSLPHAHGVQLPTSSDNVEHDLLLNTLSSNARYQVQHSDNATSVFGLSANYANHKIGGFSYLIPAYTTSGLAGFVFQKFKINNQLFVNAGLRYDQAFMSLSGIPSQTGNGEILGTTFNLNRSFGNFSGASGLSYIINEFNNIKFNIGSSFRMPTPNELAAGGVHHGAFRFELGDTTLNSERGWQADFGWHHHKQDFMFSFTPYFYYFTNYIFLTPQGRFSPIPGAGQIYSFLQTEATISGAEMKTDYHLNKSLHLGLTGEYVLAYDIVSGYPLPFTPPFSSEFEIGYEKEKLGRFLSDAFVNVSFKAFAAQNLTARNELKTPGYHLINISLGTDVLFKEHPVSVRFNILNLTNNLYFNHLSRYRLLNLPEPGRNFRIDIIIPFTYKSKS
jgi:iron complex outermembrane recepter protein